MFRFTRSKLLLINTAELLAARSNSSTNTSIYGRLREKMSGNARLAWVLIQSQCD
jgi:hypothetical protein